MFSRFVTKNFRTNWLSDPSTYPIIGVITAASTMLCGVSTYFLLYEPDIRIRKEKNRIDENIPNNFQEGEKWQNGPLQSFFRGKDPSHISMFHPIKTLFEDKKR